MKKKLSNKTFLSQPTANDYRTAWGKPEDAPGIAESRVMVSSTQSELNCRCGVPWQSAEIKLQTH